jgi:hypothetical protein
MAELASNTGQGKNLPRSAKHRAAQMSRRMKRARPKKQALCEATPPLQKFI